MAVDKPGLQFQPLNLLLQVQCPSHMAFLRPQTWAMGLVDQVLGIVAIERNLFR